MFILFGVYALGWKRKKRGAVLFDSYFVVSLPAEVAYMYDVYVKIFFTQAFSNSILIAIFMVYTYATCRFCMCSTFDHLTVLNMGLAQREKKTSAYMCDTHRERCCHCQTIMSFFFLSLVLKLISTSPFELDEHVKFLLIQQSL